MDMTPSKPQGRANRAKPAAMEAAIATRALCPLPAAATRRLLARAAPRGFASVSVPSSSGGDGGGGGRGGGTGGGGGGDSGGGAAAAAAAAAAALGESEPEAAGDAIVLHVGGLTCGGCAEKVKEILESQPQVAAATIDLEKAIALVWATPEAKATKDWQKQLGEKLANHLTTCGFQSHLPDENEAVTD
ncbi:hypothetical protein ACP4OV_012434 [Aristida adscensionis]